MHSAQKQVSQWKFVNNSVEDIASPRKIIKKKPTRNSLLRAQWVNLYDVFVSGAPQPSATLATASDLASEPQLPSQSPATTDATPEKLRIDFLLCH